MYIITTFKILWRIYSKPFLAPSVVDKIIIIILKLYIIAVPIIHCHIGHNI